MDGSAGEKYVCCMMQIGGQKLPLHINYVNTEALVLNQGSKIGTPYTSWLRLRYVENVCEFDDNPNDFFTQKRKTHLKLN